MSGNSTNETKNGFTLVSINLTVQNLFQFTKNKFFFKDIQGDQPKVCKIQSDLWSKITFKVLQINSRSFKEAGHPVPRYFRSSHPEVLRKRYFENKQQIYRRTLMLKCDFNKVAFEISLRHECSPVSLLRIFRTPFHKNTYMEGCFYNF